MMGSAGDTNADRPEDGAPVRLRHASRKCDAGGSEEISRLTRFYQPPRMVARHAGGDAASGRAAIDLAIGEHAQIAGRRGRRRVVGKDRTIEQTQAGRVRVNDVGFLPDRPDAWQRVLEGKRGMES